MIEKVNLKNITKKIGSGATPRGGQSVYQTQGISLIRSQNVLDFSFSTNGLVFINDKQAADLNNVTVEENDILLNITGDSIARVCVVPKSILPARVNQHVSIIRCTDKVDSKYVFYYLQYLKSYLLKICGVGGTRNALTKEALEKLDIILHDNQKARASILAALDLKIELNNRINTELEAMAKTLYDYWFVQFDFPDANGKPYKTSGGKMVYNATLKREIPEEWEVSELRNLVDVVKGNISPADILPTTPYVGLEHIGRKTIVLSDWTTSDTASSDKTVFKKHDILFGKIRPYFHKVAVALFDGITSTDTILLRPKKSEYFGLALETVFTEKFVNTATSSSTGSKMPRADWNVLQHYKIPVPDLPLLQNYQELFDKMLAKIEISVIESRKLTLLRYWLLPMLMNGQVVVANKVEI